MKEIPKEKPLHEVLKERSLLKQNVYIFVKQKFEEFKLSLHDVCDELKTNVNNEKVRTFIEEKGSMESHLFVGSDVLVFNMHSNIFLFPDESAIQKSSYVKDRKERAYCGVINVYNFLADSFLHSRLNDPGYLLARIFINDEGHFLVEGKGKLGFLYRDFMHNEFTKDKQVEIIEHTIRQAAEFDLLTPPYDIVNQISVRQIQTHRSEQQMKTGKRLGFQFGTNNKEIK